MKNVLIINAVPTNNGDAALVFGLKKKLTDMGCNVQISTLRIDTVKKLYPDIKWIKAEYEFNRVERKIISFFPTMREKFIKSKVKKNKFYKDIDLVISAPGGYINSYYGINDRMVCMNEIKKLYNPKLVMYSQSVGPLNEEDTNILKEYISIFDLFMARDDVSYENVKYYKRAIQTNDAAFLLDKIAGNKNKNNKVAVSVRDWKFDGRSKDDYKNLIKNIVYKCVDNGLSVEFISTCQGLSNYIDDSTIAKEIVSELEEKYKKYVNVNDKYYELYALRRYISDFNFVVGTRLHMCILAMLSNVPAFNISYEVKGKECYKILDLEEYSIDYNDQIETSMEKLQNFIDNNEKLIDICEERVGIMQENANKYFEYMFHCLKKED